MWKKISAGNAVKALGRIQTITYSGKIIARANWAPDIGTKVVDREFRVVGTVERLLGPVDSPYVTIRPARSPGQTLLKLIGKDVYAS